MQAAVGAHHNWVERPTKIGHERELPAAKVGELELRRRPGSFIYVGVRAGRTRRGEEGG